MRFVERFLKQRLTQLSTASYELVVASISNPFAEPLQERIWFAAAAGDSVRVGTARIVTRGFWIRKRDVEDIVETTIASDGPAAICRALGIAGPIPRHARWMGKEPSFDSGDPSLLTDLDGSRIVYHLDEISEADDSQAFFKTFTTKLNAILSVDEP